MEQTEKNEKVKVAIQNQIDFFKSYKVTEVEFVSSETTKDFYSIKIFDNMQISCALIDNMKKIKAVLMYIAMNSSCHLSSTGVYAVFYINAQDVERLL